MFYVNRNNGFPLFSWRIAVLVAFFVAFQCCVHALFSTVDAHRFSRPNAPFGRLFPVYPQFRCMVYKAYKLGTSYHQPGCR